MTDVDLGLLIHELMARDLSVVEFMRELLDAHVNAYPQHDWKPLQALDFDETERLVGRWLAPAFEREPPRAKRIKALWCGLFNPIRDGETVADMYVAGTKDIELHQVPRDWNVRPAYFPSGRYAQSNVLAEVHRRAYREGGPSNDAEQYLGVGYAAKTFATLLGRVDREAILGSRKSVQVAVGWDAGEPLYIGHLDPGGFVPRPVAEARAGLELEAKRWQAYRREEEEKQNAAVRHFRHADGRIWSIGLRAWWIELDFTDTDGDRHHRTVERGQDEEPLPVLAEALVKEQLGEGFVEITPPSRDP